MNILSIFAYLRIHIADRDHKYNNI